VHAVRGITWASDRGMVLGLLGVNGAGKTTSFKMMCGILPPTEGEIGILGLDVVQEKQKARQFIGYCPQFDAHIENLTVEEHLYLYGRMKGLDGVKLENAVNDKIRDMQLTEYRDRQVGFLSGGNMRKTSVAMAVIGEPPVIFLDEPSSGMDPFARRFMWGAIQDIAEERQQSVVVLTTHSMEEAEALCSKIAIQVAGQLRVYGTAQEIKAVYGKGYDINLKFKAHSQAEIFSLCQDFHVTPGDMLDRQTVLDWFSDDTQKQDDLRKAAFFKASIEEQQEQSGDLFVEPKKVSANVFAAWHVDYKHLQEVLAWLRGSFGEIDITEMHLPTAQLRARDMQEEQLPAAFLGFQERKGTFSLSQYAVEQASLESVFNTFAQQSQHVRGIRADRTSADNLVKQRSLVV